MAENKIIVDHLANGLPVLIQPMPGVPSVAVVVLAKVGSRYESADQSGIAHFVEHMVFKGTERRPSTLEISAAIDGVGGDFNAFTSKEYTGFYIKTAAKDVELAVDMLADMLHHSTFAAEEVEKERQVILEEMNMYQDTPRDRVGELFDQLVYPDQPLGQDIIGTKASLAAIDSEKLRQFCKKWYGATNTVVSVAGAIEREAGVALVERYFGQSDAQAVEAASPAVIKQTGIQVRFETKQTDQTHMIIGVRTFAAMDERRHALAVLNTILGGNMSSRIFIEVRERRGLAYSAFTHVDAMADAGVLQCQVGLDHGRVEEAAAVIVEQFRLMKEKLVSPAELAKAKSYMRGRMALSLEDPLCVDMFAARQLLLEGAIESVEEVLAAMDAVTAEQVQAVAKDIFVEQGLNILVLGPAIDASRIEAFKQGLRL